MDMMDCCAPQWVDLTEVGNSPINVIDKVMEYFEKEHRIHNKIADEISDESDDDGIPFIDATEAHQDLDIIKNTPVKVICPKYRRSMTEIQQATYDEILSDAVKKWDLWSKKTPKPPTKQSRSVGFGSNHVYDFTCPRGYVPFNFVAKQSSKNVEGTAPSDKLEKESTADDKNNKEVEDEMEYETDDDKEDKEEENNVDAAFKKRRQAQSVQSNKQRNTILTWQNGRRSLLNRRLSSRYVSLAEAVSRFQTETPKRFRTKSNKDLAKGLSHVQQKSLIQNRLKTTIPISPALVSKNRTRATTVLCPEEREKLQLEEMKKHQFMANPIPPGILRGRPAHSVSKTVAKKPVTTATTADSTSSAAGRSKKTVTKVLVTDSDGIVVAREEITFFGVPKNTGTTKNTTRLMPFSFEERNKNMQMKKEQRLKKLQEANEAKTVFRAKPAPNFSKPLSTVPPAAKQQQRKKSVEQSGLEEEEFNIENLIGDNLSKEQQEHVRKVFKEMEIKQHIFRAKPAPVFKPVMVRGTSKQNFAMKEKVEKNGRINDENQKPHAMTSKKTTKENDTGKTKRSIAHITVDKQNAASSKGKTGREIDPFNAPVLKLNTDKRARERREFDERIKRKEIEEEAKRQEENSKKLKHEEQLKAQLRKLAEVKARPMPTYSTPVIAKATKILTDPQSPAFASKLIKSQKM